MIIQFIPFFFFYLYIQFFALSQLRATRTVSGRSVPIIASVAAGAGALIRLFGPESMGGAGDIGARIDAEVTRTGLSADEIGSKVTYLASCFRWAKRPCIQRYIIIQKGNSFAFLAFL